MNSIITCAIHVEFLVFFVICVNNNYLILVHIPVIADSWRKRLQDAVNRGEHTQILGLVIRLM